MSSTHRELTLWLPQYVFQSQYTREQYLRLREGYVHVFRSQPEVEIGLEPDWSIDPLDNKTWKLYFHGLTWLLAATWGIDNGDDKEFAQAYIRDLVRSYLRDNVFAEAVDEMVWDDHATADRLAMLSYLWQRYLGPDELIEPGELESAARIHVEQLLDFYDSGKWIVSNHGLFHALALLDASLVFPQAAWSKEARRNGEEYLRHTVTAIVDPVEGISTEQSCHYHQFALRVLRSMKEFLTSNFSELHELIDGLTDRMVDFNLCIRGDGDVMPAIGDTRVSDRIPSDCLQSVDSEVPSDHLEYIESNGRSGKPFDNLVVYPRTGFGVFRDGDPPAPLSRAVFAVHPERIGHGHFDALSITLHLRGRDVLIDSGGPYKYGDFLRFGYFVATRAHNVLLVDDADHEAPAEIRGWGSTRGLHWMTAQHRGYEDRIVSRTVLWDPGRTLFVFDDVTAAGYVSRYDIIWHLPPETSVTDSRKGAGLTTVFESADGLAVSRMLATTDVVSRVEEGVLEPRPQGWVTEKLGQKRPAPVQVVSCRADAFRSVTAFGESADQARIEHSDDGPRIEVKGVQITFDSSRGIRVA